MTPARTTPAKTRTGRRRWALAVPVLAATAIGAGLVATPTWAEPGPAEGPQTWSVTAAEEAAGGNTTTDAAGTRLADVANAPSAKTDRRTGIQVFEAESLAAPVNTIGARLDADIPADAEAAVDVRGLRPDGTWSEWTEILPDSPAVLAEATATVQARVVLIAPEGVAGPQVRGVSFDARQVADAVSTEAVQAEAADTYRVFATREGLVGGTTANGHVIKSRDHFVALPSRKGLANNNSGNYSVQVCTDNKSRCEWAPVWDVGPWNTKDDYWNSSRQMWKDLPKGKPEAQAAYSDGYNGGKDEFGRKVANPAGIDLADGTFWDGLKLSDNSWVRVSYEWTGRTAWGTINTAGDPLNVRSAAKSSASQVGLAGRYAQVQIDCQVKGESVTGPEGKSDIWYQLDSGKYVSRAYVKVGKAPSAC